MQAPNNTNDELERDRTPVGVSNQAPATENLPGTNSDIRSERSDTGAYSSEEQALVEERLKNLGYL